MAFKVFEKPAPAVKVAKTPRVKAEKPAKTPRHELDQATIERTSGNGFLMHLTVTATQRLGLTVGDRIVMAYNSRSGRIGFRKDPNGDHVCQAHGNNPRRVKWGITKFLKAHDLRDSIEGRKIAAPLKTMDEWETF